MKLNRKISLATSLFTTVMILMIGLLVFKQWFSTLETQLEFSARDLAITISGMEAVQFNLTRSNGSIPIQRKAEELKLATRTQYIHIINAEGIYYAHTYPGFLNTREKDPFILDQLKTPYPEMVIRHLDSSPLPSIEAIAPVYYQGELAGLVIAGMLNGRIYQDIRLNLDTFILFIILAVFISIYSSGILSYNIKKSMHGMEPEEISRLLGQRAMTLENLKEGIITIDQNARIVYFNAAARFLTGLNSSDMNQPVDLYYFKEEFNQCLELKKALHTDLVSPSGLALQCRFEPILDDHGTAVLGATALMEDLTEVRARAEEITGIRQINEGLRAQNHEFLNKLHTISGLIQLEEYEEAIQFITGISHNRKEMIARLNSRIKDPSVAGLLLGKYNKAQEQKVSCYLEDNSFLEDNTGLTDQINLILGNLIENSLEELRDSAEGSLMVKIHQKPSSVTLQVADTGSGIKDTESIFLKGFSTKGPGRGLGLYLIREKITRSGGSIEVNSQPGNTCFTVKLPLPQKKERE